MTLSEGDEIKYKGLCGFIDFVCATYVVFQVNSSLSIAPARLLIYTENYDQVEITKTSSK